MTEKLVKKGCVHSNPLCSVTRFLLWIILGPRNRFRGLRCRQTGLQTSGRQFHDYFCLLTKTSSTTSTTIRAIIDGAAAETPDILDCNFHINVLRRGKPIISSEIFPGHDRREQKNKLAMLKTIKFINDRSSLS